MKMVLLAALTFTSMNFAHAASNTPALDLTEGKGLTRFALKITHVGLNYSNFDGEEDLTISASNPLTIAGVETYEGCEISARIYKINDQLSVNGELRILGIRDGSQLVLLNADNNKVYLDNRESTNITPIINAFLAAAKKYPHGLSDTDQSIALRARGGYTPNELHAAKLLKALGNDNLERGFDVLKNLEKICKDTNSWFTGN
jgi:hypothetical protein